MTRHARIPPTREIFIPTTRGSDANEKGVHSGHLIDDDDEYAQIEFMVPYDYHGFYEAYLVFIPITTVTMTMNIQADYCAKNEVYNLNAQGAFEKSVATVADCLQELDISDIINGDASVSPIGAGDYVGVQAQRIAGQNTDALILGIRFRYKIFKHK